MDRHRSGNRADGSAPHAQRLECQVQALANGAANICGRRKGQ
jgi:hypothetical protein